jgi:hypothetical protein
MKRFLSTTAVLVALSGAAYADAHASNFGMVEYQQNDFLASDLIGMRIYNAENGVEGDGMIADGAEQEWDDIGEINDIILSKDGDVRAVILGIGGFLGIGERDVSVSMDSIKVVQEDGDVGDRFLVVTTTKEALEAAPEFDRGMHNAMDDDGAMENANDDATNDDATVVTPMDDTTGLMRPAYEREGYQEAEMADVEMLTAEDITGAYVYGENDETVGEIDTLMVSDDGKVTDAVINVGGFLGLGEKPVLVSFDKIQVLKNADGDDYRFYIDSTKEKLEALPEYEG